MKLTKKISTVDRYDITSNKLEVGMTSFGWMLIRKHKRFNVWERTLHHQDRAYKIRECFKPNEIPNADSINFNY